MAPIRTSAKDSVFFISIEDHVSMNDNLEFARCMKEALTGEFGTIIVTVNAKVINSYCLGTLLTGFRDAGKCGKSLRAVCDQPHSLSSIQRFDTQGRLPVYRTAEEALSEE